MSEYNNELIEFPKDWEVKKLGEIAKIESGKREKGGGKETGEVISLGGEHISPDGKIILNSPKYISKKFYDSLKSGKVKEKDIILVKDGATTGKAAFVEKLPVKEVAVNEHLFIIRSKTSNIDQKFLYYIIISDIFQNQIKSLFHGIIGGIAKSEIEEVYIPIPPLEEQKKIVEILNTIDFIITDTTNLIEKLKLLKEKTLNLLITGKIWHKEFKDTEIERIPREWKIVKLEEITTKIADIDHKMPKKQKNGIPFVSIKCMLKYPDLNFYLDLNDPDLEFISKEDYEYYARRFNVEKGDIIYSRFGSIGHAKLVTTEQPFIASYSIVLIKPDTHKVNSAFLTYILNSEVVIKQAKIATKGSANKNLHLRDIKNLKISLPPLEEQKKMVEILSTIDKKIETETKYLDYMKKLKEKLLAALMTGKIRVNSITIGDLR
jgi:type I restriction enzyme S subunit